MNWWRLCVFASFVFTVFFPRQHLDFLLSPSGSSSFCRDRHLWQSSEDKGCREWALPLHEPEGETCRKGTIYISGCLWVESKETVGCRYWNRVLVFVLLWQNEVKSKLKLYYGDIKQTSLCINAKFNFTRWHFIYCSVLWGLKNQHHQCFFQSQTIRMNLTSKMCVFKPYQLYEWTLQSTRHWNKHAEMKHLWKKNLNPFISSVFFVGLTDCCLASPYQISLKYTLWRPHYSFSPLSL